MIGPFNSDDIMAGVLDSPARSRIQISDRKQNNELNEFDSRFYSSELLYNENAECHGKGSDREKWTDQNDPRYTRAKTKELGNSA